MRIRVIASLLSAAGVALAGTVVAAPPVQAVGKVIAVSGDLVAHGSVTPGTSNPARQLVSGRVRVVEDDDLTTATVTLGAVPGPADQAYLRLNIGQFSATGSCDPTAEYTTRIYGSLDAGWSRSGATYTLDSNSEWLVDDYNCAFAAVAGDLTSSPPTYDVLGGTLNPEYAQPALQVASVELLGKPKLKLVPGVWTKIDVEVRNTGTGVAGQVVVRGKGKGLKVKAGTVPYEVYPDSTGTAKLTVKLTRKRTAKLAIAVSSGVAQAATAVKVKPGRAPARLRAGKYRSKNGNVTFQVKGGRMVGFRIYAQTTCGGYPEFPTHTMTWYDMPTTKVSRAGIVDAVDRGELYTATLSGRAKGSKVKARFTYGGPDRCRASESFVARRVG
ncbi:hypothetical protein RB608_21535 [Nocardioides sp. LHD-245]|uniref:hypothetical protein n=1 Tax=Nocardioides sp. LHD-245 TaxID=3051387 RepID=UPI0027E18954|nr:hypothetical protein [Nocardioides sp. LHD-245]